MEPKAKPLPERLDKLLAGQGLGTRSEVQKMIRSGQVRVDGCICRQPAQKVDGHAQHVEVAGRPVGYKQHLYIMLNKPAGLLCVSRDPKAPTVMDLLPAAFRRRGLFPAGRLDKDTVGLVLITDDGDFAHRMLSPKALIYKRYQAIIDGRITQAHIAAFAAGTSLSDGMRCLPAGLRILEDGEHPLVEIRIAEGKFHQIKRMFQALGRQVLWLKRVSMGNLELDASLEEGMCREMTEEEKTAVFTHSEGAGWD